jgi:hypothetical protein
MHNPAVAVIVADRQMHKPAVIPQGKRSDLPLDAAGKLRARRMLQQKFEQRPTLRLCHTIKAAHDPHIIDVERAPAGLWVHPDERVDCRLSRFLGLQYFGPHLPRARRTLS